MARESATDGRFPVVALGASAGGVASLQYLFSLLPADGGIAYVVITHLKSDMESALRELIARKTALKVVDAEDAMAVAPDHVYVLQPGYDIEIRDGRVKLFSSSDASGFRAPINRFFRSLAHDRRELGVAVVLSGTGTDGTVGVKEVKGALGLTIAEDPATAEYPGMPRSAVESGYIDHAVTLDQMPGILVDYRDRVAHLPASPALTDDDRSTLMKILAVVRSNTGHDFSAYKTSTLYRRVQRRMTVQQVESLGDYLDLIQRSSTEPEQLFKDLLIGVTSFFRDPEAFEALKRDALPLLAGSSSVSEIRAWVPGCSTGEEAYSIAILISEFCAERGLSPEVSIFATDISADAVERARRGVYPDSIATDVSPARLQEHFEHVGDTYRVRKHIRNTMVFSVQDLTADPPFTRIDLVSCRNLLIYLDGDMQKKIIPLLHYSLRDEGILFLGGSETIGAHSDLFGPVSKEHKIFRRIRTDAASGAGLTFALRRSSLENRGTGGGKTQPRLEERMREYLLTHHTPSAVFVGRNYEILYIQGRTGKYLEPSSGQARMNLLDMARQGLETGLAAALREAFRTGSIVRREAMRARTNGDEIWVDVEVSPFPVNSEHPEICVVLFRERSEPPAGRERGSAEVPEGEENEYIRHLEDELQSTRERLQTAVEELETTNEELKSALEESQSANEELQSSNEELESSK